MDWREIAGGKEAAHWKGKYKRSVRLCKRIWEYRQYISDIKYYLARADDCGASELWNELEYDVQKDLITAPRFGGPFTTQERAKIKELWEISADELK